MNLFGLGPAELGIIAVLVLIFFGPKKLPEIGKSIGNAMKGIRDGLDGKDDTVAAPAPIKAAEEAAQAVVPAQATPVEVEVQVSVEG